MIRRSAGGARRAFTLVELLIVLLLMAILMAFIVPKFFGARQQAGDRVAQQTLRTAVSTATQFAEDTESYSTASATALHQAEPNIFFVAAGTASTQGSFNADGSSAGSGNSHSVSVDPQNQNLTLAAVGANDACWFVRLHYGADGSGNSQPDEYGVSRKAAAGSCTATAMDAVKGTDAGASVQTGSFPAR